MMLSIPLNMSILVFVHKVKEGCNVILPEKKLFWPPPRCFTYANLIFMLCTIFKAVYI